MTGCAAYSAPEVSTKILGKLNFIFLGSENTEVFFFLGVLCTQVCCHSFPVAGKHKEQSEKNTYKNFREIISECINDDPGSRPKIGNVLQQWQSVEL